MSAVRRPLVLLSAIIGLVLVAVGVYDRSTDNTSLQMGYFLAPALAMIAPSAVLYGRYLEARQASRWAMLALLVVLVNDASWGSAVYLPQIFCPSISAVLLGLAALGESRDARRVESSSTLWFRRWSWAMPLVVVLAILLQAAVWRDADGIPFAVAWNWTAVMLTCVPPLRLIWNRATTDPSGFVIGFGMVFMVHGTMVPWISVAFAIVGGLCIVLGALTKCGAHSRGIPAPV